MAGQSNKPAKRESQPPKKGAGSPGFKMAQDRAIGLDPVAKQVVMAMRQSTSGPLPSSTEFANYEEAMPGAADRILRMAEKEQDARLAENQVRLGLDRTLVDSINWQGRFGQVVATVLVAGALVSSHFLGMAGHDKLAIATSTTAIGSILTAFVVARVSGAKKAKEPADD